MDDQTDYDDDVDGDVVFRDIDCSLDHELGEGDSVCQRAVRPGGRRSNRRIGTDRKRRLSVPLSHRPVKDDRQNSNNGKDDGSGPDYESAML